MNYIFEGFSVWLELKEDDSLTTFKSHMDTLREIESDGGTKCAPDEFTPHITILYNFDFESETHQTSATELLKRCTAHLDGASEKMKLLPSEWFSFDFPGFRSTIGGLLLENTSELEKLRKKVKSTFPPDARGDEFTPHLSAVYAAMDSKSKVHSYVTSLQEKRVLLGKPLTVEAISVWSTRGRIRDWYRVARVVL